MGPPGSEISIASTDQYGRIAVPFTLSWGNEQSEVQNLIKERYTVLYRRHALSIALSFVDTNEQRMFALAALNAQSTQELAFIWANNWPVYSEPYTTDDTTHVTLKSNPMLRLDKQYNAQSLAAQVAITGVFTTNDVTGAQGGTNYFTGGSFNRSTWQVTLGNGSPGAAGTQVYVNYTFTGALVKIASPGLSIDDVSRFFTDGSPLWAVSGTLVGV